MTTPESIPSELTASELPAAVAADLEALHVLAIDLALEAGRLVCAGRDEALADPAAVTSKTTRTDVVTAMDKASEALLRERLAAARPQDAILGEEAGASAGSGQGDGLTWVVDPIDGTVNYTYGRIDYAVSVAVVLGDPTVPGAWHPVAGAVAQPETGEVFHAALGRGAHRRSADGHDIRLRVQGASELGMTLLATGFGYDAQIRAEQARALVEILPRVRDIRRGGSAALDLCSVATGEVDAYAERGVNPWDVAAGRLVVTEAGGAFQTWPGGAPGRPDGVCAAPRAVVRDLAALMAGAYAGACGN